jgi:hypothetical protein
MGSQRLPDFKVVSPLFNFAVGGKHVRPHSISTNRPIQLRPAQDRVNLTKELIDNEEKSSAAFSTTVFTSKCPRSQD